MGDGGGGGGEIELNRGKWGEGGGKRGGWDEGSEECLLDQVAAACRRVERGWKWKGRETD